MTEQPKQPLRTSDDVFRLLHDDIVEGRRKPGERLRESDLADSVGLSRTPVREALQRLESTGLVEHIPHKGAVIRQLDYQAANELYQMREVLEGASAAFAARHISEPELEALFDILGSEAEVVDDPKAASRLNKSFHTALAHAAHNRYLLSALDSLGLAMALLGPTTLSLPERKQHALAEHRAILDAIRLRDPVAASEAARSHIRKSHRARLKILLETRAAGP